MPAASGTCLLFPDNLVLFPRESAASAVADGTVETLGLAA